MQIFFAVCLGVGAGYTVIGFLLGEIFGLIDFSADIDSDFSGGAVSPLKPVIIAAFLTVFGGIGLILLGSMNLVTVLSVAALSGFIVSYLLYAYVIVPLHRAQNTSAVERQSLIGTNAKVTEYIPQGGYGKITYHVNGNTYSAPAKSENGNEIHRNTNAEIVSIEKNTYYVKKKEDVNNAY